MAQGSWVRVQAWSSVRTFLGTVLGTAIEEQSLNVGNVAVRTKPGGGTLYHGRNTHLNTTKRNRHVRRSAPIGEGCDAPAGSFSSEGGGFTQMKGGSPVPSGARSFRSDYMPAHRAAIATRTYRPIPSAVRARPL